MKTLLFYDTETTGLPKSYTAPVSNGDNWPRLVQIAYILFDSTGKRIAANSATIKPEGFVIPKAAADLHGITTERALAEGRALLPVLGSMHKRRMEADVIVGHNIVFDENILGAEFFRAGLDHDIYKPFICTMKAGMDVCKLPGAYGQYKWPKLVQLHTKLFNEGFEGMHGAASDIEATARCFWEMVSKGGIKV